MNEQVTAVRNARMVLRDGLLEGGLAVDNGTIAEVSPASGRAGGSLSDVDFQGDYLLPGLVELHTDNLEKHFLPRPGVKWPAQAAVMAHDAQIVGSGITTVFDALRIGSVRGDEELPNNVKELAGAIRTAQDSNLLRAEHLIHLRCEISSSDVVDHLEQNLPREHVRLISVMDHTPGQRQFASLDTYRLYYQGKHGMSDAEMERFMQEQLNAHALYSEANRRRIVEMCRDRDIPIASHDDATLAHAAEAADDGMSIAEFPTSIEAAEASRGHGLKILMGAPNVVRGGSHSGNVSALALAKRGLLDVLSSDYVPCSLLHAAFMLAEQVPDVSLSQAVDMVTATPARAAGLQDRGEIAAGQRADFIRVTLSDGHPVVRSVWRQGVRVS